jgi:hypothetical protein
LLVRKEVAAVPSTGAFPRAGLALQVSVPTTSVGEECKNSNLEAIGARNQENEAAGAAKIQLEVVAATSEVARLLEILPMASQVFGPSENPVTGKNDSSLRI